MAGSGELSTDSYRLALSGRYLNPGVTNLTPLDPLSKMERGK
jgi:hypothetical protein